MFRRQLLSAGGIGRTDARPKRASASEPLFYFFPPQSIASAGPQQRLRSLARSLARSTFRCPFSSSMLSPTSSSPQFLFPLVPLFSFFSFFSVPTLAHLTTHLIKKTMTQNQMILQRLRGRDNHNSDSTKRAASPSTPTSMLDEDSATPTTSNSSSAASTCDVVLTRSGLAAATAAAKQQQQPKEAAGAAAAAATANAANANSAEAARPPVLCHRKSVAISYRGRGVSHKHAPPVIADACPNTPSEEALAIVTLAMFFG